MNQNEPEYMIYCSRCGSEMKNTSRYCMKCGNLNASHPLNQQYSKVIEKTNQKGFNISGKMFSVINSNEINSHNTETIGISSDPSGFNTCFFLNFLIYLILSGLIILFFFFINDMDIIGLISSNVGRYVLVLSAVFFFLYAWELLFIKINRPWWSALIPIYNFYLIADTVYNGKRIYKIITLIPIVGQLFYLVLLYKLGESFKVSGYLMALLFPIMIPKVAFGNNIFNNVRYVSSTNATEKEFKKKRLFITTSVILAAFSSVSVFFTLFSQLSSDIGDAEASYLIEVANIAVKETKHKIDSKNYSCNFEASTFYIHYKNVADYYDVPLAIFHEPVSAYVKVVNTGIVGQYEYYVSVSNGEYGFGETAVNNLTNDVVVEYPELSKDYINGNMCVTH